VCEHEVGNATVFICGCGHSGGSLLANMFAAHPAVFVPLRETGTFLRTREQAATMFEGMAHESLAAGKPFLVEKTPRHIRHLDLIREILVRPRFIIPVRDGRDVVASVARRDGYRAVDGIARWIQDNGIVAREQESDDVCVYRHEDLVAEPKAVLRRLCGFSGIPYDPAMLEYHRTRRDWFGVKSGADGRLANTTHEQFRNWQINQPIFDSAGRWRSELSEADLRPLLDGEGRRLMEWFGYR
jgi:hypothetical protein